jgi:hypothetical protein
MSARFSVVRYFEVAHYPIFFSLDGKQVRSNMLRVAKGREIPVKGDPMSKSCHGFLICVLVVLSAALSIASAQSYRTIDFPGAIATGIVGGPNPQGTSVGNYTDTKNVIHGFVLRNDVFTSFDPPGSTQTLPNWISPQGVIVGSYLDSSGASHGFILNAGVYKKIDFPGAAGTILASLNPSGQMTGIWCAVASGASGVTHSVLVSRTGALRVFDPPGAISSTASTVNPSGVVVGGYTDNSGADSRISTKGGEVHHDRFPERHIHVCRSQ